MSTPTLVGERMELAELGMEVLQELFECSKTPGFYSNMELVPDRFDGEWNMSLLAR